MSSSNRLNLSRLRVACSMISCLLIPFLAAETFSQETSISVRGAVLRELSLSTADIKAMPPFLIRDVPVIPERVRDRKDEEKVTQTTFRGVLLRDVLYKAGLKYKRKWEPGVFIQVRNKNNREIVFSFGEVFLLQHRAQHSNRLRTRRTALPAYSGGCDRHTRRPHDGGYLRNQSFPR